MSQSNIEYDLDTKGGILSQVYALIAPPQSEESKSKKKEGLDLHPYYRRPGKGHNRDTCDACQEGGSLLCCDRCPASFHFICVDPPIDEEKDIPLGGWECNKCVHEMKDVVESDDVSIKGKGKGKGKSVSAPTRRELRAKEREEQTVSEAPGSNKGEEDCDNSKGKGKGKNVSVPTKRELRAKEREEKNSQDDGGILRKSFQVLIKNIVRDNPKEFSLPREYQSNFQFPGSDKVVPARIMNRRSSGAKRKPYELDTNGNVPLPAKCCFICGKSCREKKMVACDYCPLFFHLDCLDPPLTSRPDRNWICPNHNQPFLENKMMKNDSYTRRLELWETFSLQPVDQQTVKLQFLQAVRQRNLMKRFHVRDPPRCHVQVPDSVKAAYANPAPLLPGFNELLRLKTAIKSTAPCCSHCSINNNSAVQSSSESNKSPAKLTDINTVFNKAEQNISQSDRQLWLSSVLKMQHDYIQEFCSPDSLKEVQENNYAKVIGEKEIIKKDANPPSSFNHDIMNGVPELSSNSKELVNVVCNGVSQSMNGHITSESDDSDRKRRLSLEDCMKKVVPEKKIRYDEDTMLIPVPNSEDGNFFSLNDGRDYEVNSLAQRLNQPATEKGKTDFKTNNQTVDQSKNLRLLSNEERSSNNVRRPSSASFNSEDTALRNCCSSVREQVKLVKQIVMNGVLALLAPVHGCDGPVSPVYRNKITSIGSNSFCDINLRCYGHCNNASDLHAAIFFNHIHQRYELLNYSCLGCIVDNKRIGFEGGESRQVDASTSKFRETLGEILGVDRLNQLNRIAELVKKEGVDNKQKIMRVPCKCQGEPDPLPSWEGMTQILHGSLIQIGCIRLVFTVIEKSSNSEQRLSTTQSSTVASTISDKSSNNNEDWNRPSTSGCSNFETSSVTKTM